MSMKYRLLFLILLPFFVLMGFILPFLYVDYQDIQDKNQIVQLSALTDNISLLMDSLQDELTYSILKLGYHKDHYHDELREARHQTNEVAALIEKSIKQSSSIGLETPLSPLFERTLQQLDQLNQKHLQLDNGDLSLQEFSHLIADLNADLITHLSQLARETKDTDLSRALFAYLNLIFEKLEGHQEKRLVYEGLLNKRLTPKQYRELIDTIGQQKAFKKVFFEIATDAQESIYKTIMRNPSIAEASHMEEALIQLGPEKELDISPKRWWEVQSEKIDQLREAEIRLQGENVRDMLARKEALEKNILLILLITLITLGLTLYFLFCNLRQLAQNIQKQVQLISTSGKEILNAIRSAAKTTSSTAYAVNSTSITVNELKETAQASSEQAKQVAQVSDQTLSTLRQNEKMIEETIQEMSRIQEGMKTISHTIAKLSEHSQSIKNVTDTVNVFAEQSHLLAVNAAIEAAKAGEQGKGFAVVAQEVRDLANRSRQATIHIRTILQDVEQAMDSATTAANQGDQTVANGVKQSEQTNDSIRSLFTKITLVAEAAAQIAYSSRQQLKGVKQVVSAMEKIKEASQHQVDSMHQIELEIEELNAVGESLKTLSYEYKF